MPGSKVSTRVMDIISAALEASCLKHNCRSSRTTVIVQVKTADCPKFKMCVNYRQAIVPRILCNLCMNYASNDDELEQDVFSVLSSYTCLNQDKRRTFFA